MIRILAASLLMLGGAASLMLCWFLFGFTMSGGVERAQLASGAETVASYFVDWVLLGDIPGLAYSFWGGTAAVCVGVILLVFRRGGSKARASLGGN